LKEVERLWAELYEGQQELRQIQKQDTPNGKRNNGQMGTDQFVPGLEDSK
jgi:hypothetical protein